MLKTSQEPIQCESNWKLTPWYLFPCPQSKCLGLIQYKGTFCQTSRRSSGCFWCRKLCYLSSVNCYVSIWTGCKFLNLGAEIFESRYKHHSHSPFLEWSELTFVTFLTDRVQCRSVFESPQHQHLPQAFTSSKIPDNIFFPVLRETSSKQIHLDTKELCHILWNKCHSSAWHCIKENFPELEDTIILSLLSAQSTASLKKPCPTKEKAKDQSRNRTCWKRAFLKKAWRAPWQDVPSGSKHWGEDTSLWGTDWSPPHGPNSELFNCSPLATERDRHIQILFYCRF